MIHSWPNHPSWPLDYFIRPSNYVSTLSRTLPRRFDVRTLTSSALRFPFNTHLKIYLIWKYISVLQQVLYHLEEKKSSSSWIFLTWIAGVSRLDFLEFSPIELISCLNSQGERLEFYLNSTPCLKFKLILPNPSLYLELYFKHLMKSWKFFQCPPFYIENVWISTKMFGGGGCHTHPPAPKTNVSSKPFPFSL